MESDRNEQELKKVRDWIFKTVRADWIKLTPESATVRSLVKELKNVSGWNDNEQKEAVQTRYRAALYTTKSMNGREWYQRWEAARIDAEIE